MKPKIPIRRALLHKKTYELPGGGREKAIRLDLNENTAGCSPQVPKALARLTPKTIAMYTEYEKPTRKIAKYLGVATSEMILCDGADDCLRLFFDGFVDP